MLRLAILGLMAAAVATGAVIALAVVVIPDSDTIPGNELTAASVAVVGVPFDLTATTTMHNLGPYGPVDVDTTAALTLPPDCTTTSANPQTVEDTLLAVGEETELAVTWTAVTCSAAGVHDFAAVATVAVDHPYVTDPDPTNNSLSGSTSIVVVQEGGELSICEEHLFVLKPD